MQEQLAFETPKSSFISIMGTMFNGSSPLTKEGEIILNVDQISTICDATNGMSIVAMNNGLTIRCKIPFEKVTKKILDSCNYIGKIEK